MVISLLFTVFTIYGILGFVFSIAFILRGAHKIDEAATGASMGFRIIIIPGVIVFWPLLLMKWMRIAKPKQHD